MNIKHEVENGIERMLTLLRKKIRGQDFTQIEIQEPLGWGRSYISQLLSRQKALRVDQVLTILNTIGVAPAAFFGELYELPPYDGALRRSLPKTAESIAKLRRELYCALDLLVEKKLITAEDISTTRTTD